MERKRNETCDKNCGDTSIVSRKQEAMVRRTIASMVRRTIANVVNQEQEAHKKPAQKARRLGKPKRTIPRRLKNQQPETSS